MGEMTLKQAFDECVSVYTAYRNFTSRTRAKYRYDMENLVEY
jgi:hypothetical protein